MGEGQVRDSFWYWAERRHGEDHCWASRGEYGKDLPSGKKLGDYVNEKGRMDILKLFEEHKKCWKKRYQPAPPLGAVL